MAHSEILLLKPVENLGGEGDQVRVRAGYARNYLLPRKLAIPLTESNRKQIEALRKARAKREESELEAAKKLAGRIESTRIAIAVKTGEGGKMFGAVTAADIHAKLTEAGVEIDRKKIHVYNPIKTLGQHTTKIRLHPDVQVEFSFDVVSENPIVPAAE
ncbi:MAG: 50S ribosomal protein L9 [Opitutaceae bacterium]|nr:50S ribosomal protein L9 [Opitutaceae bacterium]